MGVRRSPSFFALLLCATAQASSPVGTGDSLTPPPELKPKLRWLVSTPSFSPQLEREIAAIAREFNQISRGAQVEIHLRGDDYSTLRELSIAALAGTLPDLAMIEPSEAEALTPLPLGLSSAQALSQEAKALKLDRIYIDRSRPYLLPAFRALPVLVVDQEILLRVGGDPKALPPDWPALEALARKLVQSGTSLDDSQGQFALALPLTGSRGLFAVEALIGKPLWISEAKGLRVDSGLAAPIEKIRGLFKTAREARGGLNWEQAIQAFLERRAPILVTSTDSLPMLSGRATFKWSAVPLPQVRGGTSRLATGADLVVLKSTPAAWEFLRYLYSPRVAARWAASGGLLPLHSSWLQTSEWKNAAQSQETLVRLLQGLAMSPVRIQTRAAHPEILRIRNEWASQLPFLWSDPGESTRSGSVLAHIQSALQKLPQSR